MGRNTIIFAAACGLVTLCGCSSGNSNAEEAEKLMQTSRDWSKAAAGNDRDAVLGYFADDAVMISEGQTPVRGKPAIREHLAQMSSIPGFRIAWEPLEATVSGDMGYMLERTSVTMDGPQGEPVIQQLQAVTIWRKQADGSWKNVVDASVSGPPRP